MNSLNIIGKLTEDAKIIFPQKKDQNPLVSFSIMDSGLPYQKTEPMVIEVHFFKEVAEHIYEYLKKDKEVYVNGYLRQKNYKTMNGNYRTKYYISAEFITLIPVYKDGATNNE